MRRYAALVLVCVLTLTGAASAQTPLGLPAIIARVRERNFDVRAADARLREADRRRQEVRGGLLPRVDVVEGWQRGDMPVAAFSALLSARQFSAVDFDVARLNQPGTFDAFRTAVTAEQTVFDPALRLAIQASDLSREAAAAARDEAVSRLVVHAIEVFGQVHLFEALAAAARSAEMAGEADLSRAGNRRDAGLVTDADVQAATAALALVRSRRLATETEAAISRQQLNLLMGDPPEAALVLEPLSVSSGVSGPVALSMAEAFAARADLRLTRAREALAANDESRARSAWWPRVAVRGASEWNGMSFGDRAHAWTIGGEVRMAVFQGGAERARLAATRAARDARRHEVASAEAAATAEIRSHQARLAVTESRATLARAALSSARESQRITRDRYENGFADVTTLLAAGRAVQEAEAEVVRADVEQVVLRARLDAALGGLAPGSR